MRSNFREWRLVFFSNSAIRPRVAGGPHHKLESGPNPPLNGFSNGLLMSVTDTKRTCLLRQSMSAFEGQSGPVLTKA